MTVARTVADVLADHVTLEVESVDRLHLNVYQPRLQHVNGVGCGSSAVIAARRSRPRR